MGRTDKHSETSASAYHSLVRIYRTLSAARRRHFWLVVILSILGGAAELLTIGAIIPFLSLLTSADSDHDRTITATLFFIAAAAAAGTLRLALVWASQSFIQNVGHDLATEIQRRVLDQPYEYHVARNSSEVVASLELVHQLTYGVIQPLLQASAGAVIGLFLVAAVAWVDLPMAVIAAGGFVFIYALIALSFRRPLNRRSTVIASAYGERVRLVQESIGGIRDIIVDQAQAAHVEAFRAVDNRLTRARTEAMLASVAPRYLVETAGLMILALAAFVIGRSNEGLAGSLPTIGALALGAQRLLPLVHQLYQGWSLASANRGIAERVVALINLPMSAAPKPQPQHLREILEVKNLSFTYPGRTRAAISEVDLVISLGQAIALTGATGSGKSTLVDLLMGLLTPSQGEILIDGAPLDARAWQQVIAHVPQSVFLSDATIGANIALGVHKIDRDRVIAAAQAAELSRFVDTLPDGLDTMVGERGIRLSGGQRQRIGIARALYKRAEVLILDEATNALDEATEARVMSNLSNIAGLTMLIISHRPSTIDRCDVILRLDRGRLVAG